MLELLEHDHRRGLAHHEPVALVVERTRRARRIVVAPRERAHRVEAGDADLGDRRLACRPRTSRRRGRAGSSSIASPIAMFDAAQAVHWLISGPFVPSSIETQPAPMFGMIDGIENGLTRSGPFVRSTSVALLVAVQAADAGRDRRAVAVGRLGDVRRRSRPPPGARPQGSSGRSGPCGAPSCGRSSPSDRSPSARTRSARCSPCGRTR